MTSIYNEAINEGGFTGDIEPVSLESRESWYSEHKNLYRIFVIEDQSAVVGYVSISPYRKGREAFSSTCEISYYVSSHSRGKGLGKKLLSHAIDYAQTAGFRVLIAILLGSNERSTRLLEHFGFSECGRVREAASIGNKLIDHLYMSLRAA